MRSSVLKSNLHSCLSVYRCMPHNSSPHSHTMPSAKVSFWMIVLVFIAIKVHAKNTLISRDPSVRHCIPVRIQVLTHVLCSSYTSTQTGTYHNPMNRFALSNLNAVEAWKLHKQKVHLFTDSTASLLWLFRWWWSIISDFNRTPSRWKWRNTFLPTSLPILEHCFLYFFEHKTFIFWLWNWRVNKNAKT